MGLEHREVLEYVKSYPKGILLSSIHQSTYDMGANAEKAYWLFLSLQPIVHCLVLAAKYAQVLL